MLEEEFFAELLEETTGVELEDLPFEELDSTSELLDDAELLDVVLEEDTSNVWLCPMVPYLE